MHYRPEWDLSTVPLDKLKSEWARRNATKPRSHSCGHYPAQAERCALCKQREYRRQRRAQGLDQ